jgi:hypothetical protein
VVSLTSGVHCQTAQSAKRLQPCLGRGSTASGSSRFTRAPKKREPAAPTLESKIASMQRDSGTYCDEPEDEAGLTSPLPHLPLWLGITTLFADCLPVHIHIFRERGTALRSR